MTTKSPSTPCLTTQTIHSTYVYPQEYFNFVLCVSKMEPDASADLPATQLNHPNRDPSRLGGKGGGVYL